MNITIKTELIPTLERLATSRSISTQEHIQDYVNAYLLSQFKQHIAYKISDETVDNLVQIDEVIDSKKLEIKEAKEAYELANPVDLSKSTVAD